MGLFLSWDKEIKNLNYQNPSMSLNKKKILQLIDIIDKRIDGTSVNAAICIDSVFNNINEVNKCVSQTYGSKIIKSNDMQKIRGNIEYAQWKITTGPWDSLQRELRTLEEDKLMAIKYLNNGAEEWRHSWDHYFEKGG